MKGNPLLISFSGGRTSAFMTAVLMDYYADREKAVVFANTGKERLETLDFVDRCDRAWDLNVVWVEAVVNPEAGKGTRHKIVSYETAARDGEPFEDVIKKYGIPSRAFPNCTRELKQHPIHSYVKSLGWSDYETAVGIRADEAHRISGNSRWDLVYPLVEMGITKQTVNEWWSRQDFTLELQEHQGNCDFCWKKSDKKLIRLINEGQTDFGWWKQMEQRYQDSGNRPLGGGSNFFFRGNRSGLEMEALARSIQEQPTLFDGLSDTELDCFCKST